MRESADSNAVTELLRETKVDVAPGTFTLVALTHQNWTQLLGKPQLGPGPESPFMILRDHREVTLLVEADDWQRMSHVVPDARVETGFRLVTLDIELDWNLVGYLSRVTHVLAAAGVSVGVLSSFSRDHLLVKQGDLASALVALGDLIEELC